MSLSFYIFVRDVIKENIYLFWGKTDFLEMSQTHLSSIK